MCFQIIPTEYTNFHLSPQILHDNSEHFAVNILHSGYEVLFSSEELSSDELLHCNIATKYHICLISGLLRLHD